MVIIPWLVFNLFFHRWKNMYKNIRVMLKAIPGSSIFLIVFFDNVPELINHIVRLGQIHCIDMIVLFVGVFFFRGNLFWFPRLVQKSWILKQIRYCVYSVSVYTVIQPESQVVLYKAKQIFCAISVSIMLRLIKTIRKNNGIILVW
jgi:hypothetical protein